MATRKKSDLTYTRAAEELETILDEIESGSADVDVLGDRVERAAELIRFCRELLAGTESRVQKVVTDLVATEPTGPTDPDSEPAIGAPDIADATGDDD